MRLYKFTINKNKYEVKVIANNNVDAKLEVNGIEHTVKVDEVKHLIAPAPKAQKTDNAKAIPTPGKGDKTAGDIKVGSDLHQVKAPIPGLIKAIYVREGERVAAGQKILIMEAMKMDNVISTKIGGEIVSVLVGDFDNVGQDQIMVEIKP